MKLYEKCVVGGCVNVVKCGVMEGVKRNALRWSGHMERINSEEIVEEVYVRGLEGSSLRGRPLGRWRDKVEEYMCEGGKGGGAGLDGQ